MSPTRAVRLLLGGFLLLAATGCSVTDIPRLGFPSGITEQSQRTLNLWRGSWVAALAVGAVVLGLILWCVLVYRKRSDDLPPQVHYNIPIEALYTILPFVIIAVLFYFTARDESYLDRTTASPDCTVNVVGFQWQWQFNYIDGCDGATGLSITGTLTQPPQLVLPVGKSIKFVETSPDVIHSFWVVDFLFKRDVVPGRENVFQVTINKQGVFEGRCAELCGQYHSRMLFSLRTLDDAKFQTFLAEAKAEAAAGVPGGRYTFGEQSKESTGAVPNSSTNANGSAQ